MWSFVLAGIGVYGLYLAGRKDRRGWLIGLSAQALWVVYAVVSGQPGFILSAVAYGYVYFRNWDQWKHGPHKCWWVTMPDDSVVCPECGKPKA